jgi:hypothetical protein
LWVAGDFHRNCRHCIIHLPDYFGALKMQIELLQGIYQLEME